MYNIEQLARISPQTLGIFTPALAKSTLPKSAPFSLFSDIFIRRQTPSIQSAFSNRASYHLAIADLNAALESDNQKNLQEYSKGFLLAHPDIPPRGTLVLFHGWSAGTWQFEEIAKGFYEAGYNVYAPRLPGHGYANDNHLFDSSQLPRADEENRYEAFVERIHDQVTTLPGPKAVLGFSGGGAIAMRTIERYNTFDKAVLIAPFLRPKKPHARVMNTVFKAVNPYTGGYLGKAIDAIPYKMGRSGTAEGLEEGVSGHSWVSIGNIHALAKFGEGVIENAHCADTPIQVIMSRSDKTSDDGAISELFDKLNSNENHRWFEFPKEESVPHTMVHPKESGCSTEKTDKVYDTALAFLTRE